MSQSENLFQDAKRYITGGVNSPVRAFNAVGGTPLFIQMGKGAYIIDVDGKSYIDYVGSWGPMILGHAHPEVVKSVQDAATRGLSYGAPTEFETILAKKICELIPTIQRLRFVNSGTEATMTAIRLARGFTNRDKIIKFEGCYHGHNDALLVKAGSGALTFGVPGSAGVPADITKHTLTSDFNDLDSVKKHFAIYPKDIACVILEPVTGNMNCVLPEPGFLQGLRELCDHYQAVLIFDEVMTGFRVGVYTAQQRFEIKPDLTCLGKVIGGGMPVGAFGGRVEIMDKLSPVGPVYQAGTLSGNPIAMAAGIANLNELIKPGFFENLFTKTEKLITGILAAAKAKDVALTANYCGSMFGLLFTEKSFVKNYQDVMSCNTGQFKQFFHAMLEQGIYLAPSAFEAGFMSAAHSDADIHKTIQAAQNAFSQLSTTVV